MVRQPSEGQLIVKLWGELSEETFWQVQETLQKLLGLSAEQMSITSIDGGFLHSKKIPRQ
jgi:anti-anti-sigma regulatory factor